MVCSSVSELESHERSELKEEEHEKLAGQQAVKTSQLLFHFPTDLSLPTAERDLEHPSRVHHRVLVSTVGSLLETKWKEEEDK